MSNLKFPNTTLDNLRRIKPRDGKLAYATEIVWNADKTRVGIYHHNSLIAVIDESGTAGHQRVISVSTAGWESKTTIDRINRILRDNTRGYYGARIHQYSAYLTCAQSHYTGGGMYNVFSGHNFISIIVNDDYPSNVITDESLYHGVH